MAEYHQSDHAWANVTAVANVDAAAASFRELSRRVEELNQRAEKLGGTDFETRFHDLVRRYPAMSLGRAADLLAAGVDLDSVQKRAEWVLNQPEIMKMMEDSLKINAIKETRAKTLMGLKEAKEAVELAWDMRQRGWMSEAEKAQLEVEAHEAIESIRQVLTGSPSGLPRCPKCGHAPHGRNACYNLASDNDCDCAGV